MRFQTLRLQDFRNVAFAELDLSANRSFLLGSNGQGKSNLLEALGLVTALRSFRTQSMGALPKQGAQALRRSMPLITTCRGRVIWRSGQGPTVAACCWMVRKCLDLVTLLADFRSCL